MQSENRLFDNKYITVFHEDGKKLTFEAESVARAVGYSKRSGLDYHANDLYKTVKVAGKSYKALTIDGLREVAEKASRTPSFRALLAFALNTRTQLKKVAKFDKPKAAPVAKILPVPKTPQPKAQPWPFPPASKTKAPKAFGITEAAIELGLTYTELVSWLINEGYAERYTNGSLKWTKWFKTQDFGKLRELDDERGKRLSNVPTVTPTGITYIRNRIKSQRESGVLAFANEQVGLEAVVDKKILEAFDSYKMETLYSKAFGEQYKIGESDLLTVVKAIIADVKIK